MPAELPETVLFFDGMCGLCSHFVDFLLIRDKEQHLRYAPLQGETFQEVARLNPKLAGIDSLVVTHRQSNGTTQVLIRSRGALFVLSQLGGGWRALARMLQVIPSPLADIGYRFIASVRYRIFGKHQSCRLPTPTERELFLR